MIITVRDMRAAKMCMSGVKRFYKRHGLDFKKLLTDGTPEEELMATGDAMARKVVEVAYVRKQ